MTCPATSPFAFTQLTEPQQYASPTGLPAGFDPEIALLLGNCCNLTYSQFASGATSLTAAQIAGLWSGNSLSQLEGFIVSEAIAAGAEIGTTGEYVTLPVGFALTGSIPGRPPMNIIALRGTRTYNEWINDAEAIPAPWHVGTNNGNYYPIDHESGKMLLLYTRPAESYAVSHAVIKLTMTPARRAHYQPGFFSCGSRMLGP